MARCFESSKGHKFTWEGTVGECYKRDLAHADPVTTLNAHSVYPNSWNKMRVGCSLRPFNEKTIVEQISHVADVLGANRGELFYSSNFDNVDVPQKHIERLEILSNAISKAHNVDIELGNDMKEKFDGLELSVHIACIFNERFMNKNMKITRKNINELENEMKKYLAFFEKWRKHSLTLKKDVDNKD